jgi:hypothetical protein
MGDAEIRPTLTSKLRNAVSREPATVAAVLNQSLVYHTSLFPAQLVQLG